MGLLTGFSIISGVEIIYFGIKIIIRIVKAGKRNLELNDSGLLIAKGLDDKTCNSNT